MRNQLEPVLPGAEDKMEEHLMATSKKQKGSLHKKNRRKASIKINSKL